VFFRRTLSDFRREDIDNSILDNFVVLATVPHRREPEREYVQRRWDEVIAQVDLDDLVQHRRDPFVDRTDARIVADALARTTQEREHDRKLAHEFGWALGTLVWNARRQAEWGRGGLESAVEDVVSGRVPAAELVEQTRDFPVLLAYVIRYLLHLPHSAEILEGRNALAVEPGVPRHAQRTPELGPEWAAMLLSGLANDRALRGLPPVETTAREA